MTEVTIATEAARTAFIDYLMDLNLDKPWVITVGRKKKKRSLSQNALYHKWIDDARKEEALSGWTHDELDEALKQKCECPRHVFTGFDGMEISRYSTSTADTVEMADYMERVYRFLVGDYGVYLTLPEEQLAR